MRPEQSQTEGPAPANLYMSPIWSRAYATALAAEDEFGCGVLREPEDEPPDEEPADDEPPDEVPPEDAPPDDEDPPDDEPLDDPDED